MNWELPTSIRKTIKKILDKILKANDTKSGMPVWPFLSGLEKSGDDLAVLCQLVLIHTRILPVQISDGGITFLALEDTWWNSKNYARGSMGL